MEIAMSEWELFETVERHTGLDAREGAIVCAAVIFGTAVLLLGFGQIFEPSSPERRRQSQAELSASIILSIGRLVLRRSNAGDDAARA
jgi:hypothetical protein